jgi:hypothetical protein
MCNTTVGAGAVGAGAASCYGSDSGSDQKMRLLAAPAPQHCKKLRETLTKMLFYTNQILNNVLLEVIHPVLVKGKILFFKAQILEFGFTLHKY